MASPNAQFHDKIVAIVNGDRKEELIYWYK